MAWTKARLEEVARTRLRGARLVVVANDTEALEVVATLGGISVRVGATAPPAQYRVDGPGELLEFLIGLQGALGDRKPVATPRSAGVCDVRAK